MPGRRRSWRSGRRTASLRSRPTRVRSNCADSTCILPIAAFAETSGTWVNVEGRWQSVAGAARPPGEARPGWKVLRVLAQPARRDGIRLPELRGRSRRAASGELDGMYAAPPAAGRVCRRPSQRRRQGARDADLPGRRRRAPLAPAAGDTGGSRRERHRMIDAFVTHLAGLARMAARIVDLARADPDAHRDRDPVRGLSHARRAQGDRLHAVAHRAESRGPQGSAAALRRRDQAADQGSGDPDAFEPLPVHQRRRCSRSCPRSRPGR